MSSWQAAVCTCALASATIAASFEHSYRRGGTFRSAHSRALANPKLPLQRQEGEARKHRWDTRWDTLLPTRCLWEVRGRFSPRVPPCLSPLHAPAPPLLPTGPSLATHVLPKPRPSGASMGAFSAGRAAAAGSLGVMPEAGHCWPFQPPAPGGPQAPTQPGHCQDCQQHFQRPQAQAVRCSTAVRAQLFVCCYN